MTYSISPHTRSGDDDSALPEKPTRGFTKRMTVANNLACWLMMLFAVWLGPQLATIVVPVMATIILGLLASYQLTGHMDLRTLANAAIEKPAASIVRSPPPAPKK